MSLYQQVAEWVRLPDPPNLPVSGTAAEVYVAPPTPSFEQKWESYFASRAPPDFGRSILHTLFPTLVGDITAFDERDPDLGPPSEDLAGKAGTKFTFLAHGSYGATCRPVLDVLRKWQLRMEASPVRFFYDMLYPYIVRSVRLVSGLVGARPEDTVLVTNVEVGMNAVMRSLTFGPGDKIIAFDLTYTAVLYSAQHICDRTGAELLTFPMTFPVSSESVVADLRRFLEGYDQRCGTIRLAIFQHITSPTALLLPVRKLITSCREYNIPVMIDGAHSIGQIPVNLTELGADFYVTNTHKWLCNARGCALLWVHPRHHSRVYPLTTSWGHPNKESLQARFIWQGTADYSPFLSLHIAVKFYEWLGHDKVIQRNRRLTSWCASLLAEAWGTEPLVAAAPTDEDSLDTEELKWETGMIGSMCCVQIPPANTDIHGIIDLHDELLNRFRIEIPVFSFQGHRYVRVSLHMYNDEKDCLALGRAVLLALGYPTTYNGYILLDKKEHALAKE
ncbi:hypothetical protein SpCBS45565_g06682 [Spizellomyces sp. 'palustris']|nr:hypothetical protein SpCBS45565_g06682 [Spizellomyces sp. 'palustris']